MSGSVIVAGARTPIGRLLGGLKDQSAADLGGVAIKGALEKAGVSGDQVEYVIMGQVIQAGTGQITARQAAVKGGIPMTVPAITINKVCLSGINAIAMADQLIRAGEHEIVVAGGMESMTQAPHLLPKSREGFKYGDTALVDSMAYDALYDQFTTQPMGGLTESCNAAGANLTREEQDGFSARSHQRAAEAWKNGVFDDEVVPSLLNAGRSLLSDSAVVSPRTPSSEVTWVSPPRPRIVTGTTSSSKTPFFQASAARWWLRAEKASCSSRVSSAPAAWSR